MEPPLGTGTGRPMGTKSSSVMRSGDEHGAIIFTECPHFLNCAESMVI